MMSRQSLDGWWEFLPEPGPPDDHPAADRDPPESGYEATPIRVPGYWNTFPEDVGGNWGAYDHYDYPATWQKAQSAWYRLRFQALVPGAEPACRTRLHFDAVAGESRVWLNGQPLGRNVDSFLPFSYDVTKVIRPGANNELIVYVAPPPKANGLWLQPCGSWVGWFLRGIWQSVHLESAPPCAIEDVFAQPSVRDRGLTVDVTVETAVPPAGIELHVVVLDEAQPVLDMGRQSVRLSSSGPQVVRFEADWPDARLWSPETPRLYDVRAELRMGGRVVHRREVRFGFREFWIEGTGFRLNGRPIRLFGDSWHYMGAVQQNPAYARTWFDFARRTGVNLIRTHAMPYPPLYFDIADETGMMIIDESAVYGSAGTLAYDEERFWENCRDHIRRLVRRDRNHPSIVFWSVCNETVWKGGEAIYDGLLSLADEASKLDPTRFVSFDENDCDLGGRAVLHAGHYGRPEHWEHSWRRDRPLVVHEFSTLYHGGPDSVSPAGNDVVYADYLARLRAAGEDAAGMFLRLRSLGAASITPWNVNWYCLEPIPVDAVENVPASLVEGGAAIKRIGPRALTLNYGYAPDQEPWRPNPAYEPVAACYQRRRFFLPRRPRQGFGGQRIEVAPEVWNDQDEPLNANLTLRLVKAGSLVTSRSHAVQLEGHGATRPAMSLSLPEVGAHEEYVAELAMRNPETAETLHVETWALHVHPHDRRDAGPYRTAWIVGSEQCTDSVPAGFGLERIDRDTLPGVLSSSANGTVVLAGDPRGQTLRDWLECDAIDRWLRRGGRLVVLPGGVAEDASLLAAPIPRTCDRAFPRDPEGLLLSGLSDAHFCEWGGDGVVARTVFQRPATGPAITPLDVGDPGEGLAHAPLVIVPHGDGHVVMLGMDLPARAMDTPAAAILFRRLLHDTLPTVWDKPVALIGDAEFTSQALFREAGVAGEESGSIVICDGTSHAALADPRLSKERIDTLLAAAGTLLIEPLTPDTAGQWSERLGLALRLEEDTRYNVARACDDELLAGLNNFDLCWVQRDEKQPIVRHTLDVNPAAYRTLVQTVATRWEDYEAAAEQHKVAMMYRRLECFREPRAAVVVIPRGAGRILISQLLLREASGAFRERARRILSRWLDALGACRTPDVSPLAPQPKAAVTADGHITEWLVLGPFSGEEGHPLDQAFVPESNLRPAEGDTVAGRTWKRVSCAFPQVDVASVFGPLPPADRVAYAAVYVYAPRDRSVLLDAPDMAALLLGADGGAKVFLNGRPLGRFDFVRALVVDSDHVDNVPLGKGWNTLVIKLHNRCGRWRFAARFVTAAGEPAGELRIRIDPPR